MIRIDTSKIKKWKKIKEKHSGWYENFILPRLKLSIKILDEIVEKHQMEIKRYIFILKEIEKIDSKFVLKKDLNKCVSIKSKKIFHKNSDGKKSDLEIELKKIKDSVIDNGLKKIGEIIESKEQLKEIKKKYDDEKDNDKFLLELGKYSNINLNLVKWYIKNKSTKKEKINEINLNSCLIEIKTYKDLLPEKIFDYDNFSNKEKEKSNRWGRHSLLTMMGIEVCPYCQRNYITNYKDENKKELTTADLDHFYSQAQYPYLALSLYNFIPSCHTCNSTMKGQNPIGLDTHIYPYTDSMEEDIKFTIKIDSAVDNLFIENKNLEIGINVDIISKEGIDDTKRNKKIENSLKTFKLREVYQNSHSNYVGDLIHNFQKYPKSYTKALGEIFIDKPHVNNENDKSKCEEEKDLMKLKEYEEKLKIINDNFQDIIKKSYVDRIEKGEPLAKLTKDIMDELGIK